jgi:hypothetical protein
MCTHTTGSTKACLVTQAFLCHHSTGQPYHNLATGSGLLGEVNLHDISGEKTWNWTVAYPGRNVDEFYFSHYTCQLGRLDRLNDVVQN